MARKNVKRYVLRYTVAAGLPSGAVLLAVAAWRGVPPLLASLVLLAGPLIAVPLIVGATEAGIETASAGAEAGFMSGSNPTKYQPDSLPIPDALAIVCWLTGVGVVGLAGFVAFS